MPEEVLQNENRIQVEYGAFVKNFYSILFKQL